MSDDTVEIVMGETGFGANYIDEDDQTASLDEYFAARKPFRVVYQTSNYFLPQIVDLIMETGNLNLRPDYQRRPRWSSEKQSALIESMLLNIPVPPIYLYENAAARYEVMDGQQRINAIRDFFSNQLELKGLKILSRLNGLKYEECPPHVLRTLARANVSTVVLLLESDQGYTGSLDLRPSDLRRHVFDRLNTGGIKLNAQEIRNAMNPGPLKDAILRMSQLPVFTDVFGIPAYDPDDKEGEERRNNKLYAKMGDCELALRFVALRDEGLIRGGMRDILDRAMAKKLTKEEADIIVTEFRERLEFLSELFEGRPFQIEDTRQQSRRVYAAIYDASIVALDRHWDQRESIRDRATEIRRGLRRAFEDEEQRNTLTGRLNTAKAVRDRISLLGNLLLGKVG